MWIFGDTACRTSYAIYNSLNFELVSLWIHRLCTVRVYPLSVTTLRNEVLKPTCKPKPLNCTFQEMSVFCLVFWYILASWPTTRVRGEKQRRRWWRNQGKVQQTNKQTSKEKHPTTRLPHPWFFHPQPLNNKHPSSHKVSLFSRLGNFFLFSLFNNFISCFRREEVLLSLFPVFYSCSILSSPSFASLVTLSASSLPRTSPPHSTSSQS